MILISKSEKSISIWEYLILIHLHFRTAIDPKQNGTLFKVYVTTLIKKKHMYASRSLRLLSKNFIINWDQDKIAFVSTGAALGFVTEKLANWILVHYPAHLFIRTFIVTLLAAHFISALALVHDLFKISQRNNKSLWAFIILTLPAFNLFLYRLFMKRHKSYSRRSYLY